MQRRTVISAVIAGLAATSVTLAAPAADEASFMQDLYDNAVSYSQKRVISVGYGACQILRGGTISTAKVTMNQAINYAYNAAYLRGDAVGIVTAAARQLCPDQLPVARAYFNNR